MKQFFTTLKKVLFTAIIFVMVSAEGNAKTYGDSTILTYAKKTHSHTGEEVARGLENGTLPLNLSIDRFVEEKTKLLNAYRVHYDWRDANGNQIAPIKVNRAFIASLYRNSTKHAASWASDQAVVSFYYEVKDKKGNVVRNGVDYWNRGPYAGEQLFCIDPYLFLGGTPGKYPAVILSSDWCLQEVLIQEQQTQVTQTTSVTQTQFVQLQPVQQKDTWVPIVNQTVYLPSVNGGVATYNGGNPMKWMAIAQIATTVVGVTGQLIANHQQSGGNTTLIQYNNSSTVTGGTSTTTPTPIIIKNGSLIPGQGNGATTTTNSVPGQGAGLFQQALNFFSGQGSGYGQTGGTWQAVGQ